MSMIPRSSSLDRPPLRGTAPRSLFVLLALLLGLPQAVRAEEGRPLVWTFQRGGDVRELVVQDLDRAARQRLVRQMKERGFARVDGMSPQARADVAALVEHGGRLPEGFRPAGFEVLEGAGEAEAPDAALVRGVARATGRVILRYLEQKDDPARSEAWEEVLARLGTRLAQMRAGSGSLQTMGMELMSELMAGFGDETRGPVYREIFQIFTAEVGQALLGGGAEPLDMRAPASLTFAGARVLDPGLTPVPSAEPKAYGFRIADVPSDSLAARIGLQPGDEVLALGSFAPGLRVEMADRLLRRAVDTGAKLDLRIRRKEREQILALSFVTED